MIQKYTNNRPVGGDYFQIQKRNKYGDSLDFYLDKFDPKDYIILKSSNSFRIVSTEDFLGFKYSNYTFFSKDLYEVKDFEMWIDFIYNELKIGSLCKFVSKPFPPINVIKKINVI